MCGCTLPAGHKGPHDFGQTGTRSGKHGAEPLQVERQSKKGMQPLSDSDRRRRERYDGNARDGGCRDAADDVRRGG